jgi:protease IV
MKSFFVRALAGLGALVLLGGIFLIALVWAVLPGGTERLPDRFVLEMDLGEGIVDHLGEDPFLLAVEGRRPRLRDLLDALDAAERDPRVAGLRVVGGGGLGGWALTDELRDAIVRFRASGKPTLYFAESFGEFIPAQGAYHLATAFDEIVLQPSGELGIAPLSVEAPFLAGALEKLSITPRFGARGEYKDAADLFTRTGFSPASREALTALLETLTDGLVEGIASGRRVPADSARRLVARGPWSAREALAAGLVDRLDYRDDAWAGFLEEEPALPVRTVRSYRSALKPAGGSAARVALIHGVGEIQGGRGGDLFSTGGFRAGLVADAIREASEDPTIQAILFRVDSPGGSYVASDLVRHELRRARERGLPVVVSMGNAAASGGYMVSLEADRIVAQPSTITGSIGVLAGKFAVESFLESFGVTLDRVDLGDPVPGFSSLGDLSPADLVRLDRALDRIYEDFVEHVARGRGMTFDAAHEVARGRVWSGRDTRAKGLVDALGGYRVATAELRTLLDLAEDAAVELVPYPPERTLFQLLLEEARGGGTIRSGFSVLSDLVRGLRVLGGVGAGPVIQLRTVPFHISGS